MKIKQDILSLPNPTCLDIVAPNLPSTSSAIMDMLANFNSSRFSMLPNEGKEDNENIDLGDFSTPPEEIILYIATFLPPHGLLNLAFTCKFFYQLLFNTMPHLIYYVAEQKMMMLEEEEEQLMLINEDTASSNYYMLNLAGSFCLVGGGLFSGGGLILAANLNSPALVLMLSLPIGGICFIAAGTLLVNIAMRDEEGFKRVANNCCSFFRPAQVARNKRLQVISEEIFILNKNLQLLEEMQGPESVGAMRK